MIVSRQFAACPSISSCTRRFKGSDDKNFIRPCRTTTLRRKAARTNSRKPLCSVKEESSLEGAQSFSDELFCQPVAAPEALEQLRVVLVSPKTAANIGAVARACENFELSDLVIVAPRCDPYSSEVQVVSCESSVLGTMTVTQSLSHALDSAAGSIGFTRRAGAKRTVHTSMYQLLRSFPQAIPGLLLPGDSLTEGGEEGAEQGCSALVFGREESGLTEGEAQMCSHLCAIPSGRLQPSLNLSHSVAVILSQCFEWRVNAVGAQRLDAAAVRGTAIATGGYQSQRNLQAASGSEVAALVERWSTLVEAAGLGDDPDMVGRRAKNISAHFKALVSRSRANTQEVRALHLLARELGKMIR